MELVRYSDAQTFYARAEAFLLAREAEHNLLLGIGASLYRQPGYYSTVPYLATVERDGRVALVALRTPPHHPVLSLPAPDLPDNDITQALDLLVADLRATYAEGLAGIFGPSSLSLPFAERWCALTGCAYSVAVSERIYRLDAVMPVVGVCGAMRAATEADRELLERWVVAFQDEALPPTEIRMPPAHWVTQRMTPPLRGVVIWEDCAGQPVTMVGYTRSTPHGATIGPVYTPPDQRRQGYASACVAAISQRLLDEGRQFCSLFTNQRNPTSNHIYQTIGYHHVGDVTVYDFEMPQAGATGARHDNGETNDASA